MVRELGLPVWMYLFPLGRFTYAYFPTGLKRVLRRDPGRLQGEGSVRILFLSTSMGLGGADQQLLSAAQVLRARGHEILIVSLTPLGPMGLEARASGLRTESLEMARGIPDPRGLYRLAKLARAWKPEVVHSHMVHANLMARALRLIVPVPVLVSTIHNIYEGGPVWMAAYRLTNRSGGSHDDHQRGRGRPLHRRADRAPRAADRRAERHRHRAAP